MSRPSTMYGTDERDDELPIAPPTVLERLGAASIELEHIKRILAASNAAMAEVNAAVDAGHLGNTVLAADKLAKAGDLMMAARIFARACDRLLSKERGKKP